MFSRGRMHIVKYQKEISPGAIASHSLPTGGTLCPYGNTPGADPSVPQERLHLAQLFLLRAHKVGRSQGVRRRGDGRKARKDTGSSGLSSCCICFPEQKLHWARIFREQATRHNFLHNLLPVCFPTELFCLCPWSNRQVLCKAWRANESCNKNSTSIALRALLVC